VVSRIRRVAAAALALDARIIAGNTQELRIALSVASAAGSQPAALRRQVARNRLPPRTARVLFRISERAHDNANRVR